VVLLFSLLTIFMAVVWLQMVAGELVGCLRACGILIRCPQVLLGFSLAIINSLGDQATNTSVARVSGKRAAFAACFSGQTFNVAVASLCGYVLNSRQTHQGVVPLHVSQSTWLLWGTLATYLCLLLSTIGVRHLQMGRAELPHWAGSAARLLFGVLVAAFWVTGLLHWR
jgi:Ca2+/Na+ antiporter